MNILTIKDACKKLGISRSGYYRLEKSDPTFPRRRKICGSKTGAIDSEMDAWLKGRPVINPADQTIRKPGPGRGRKKTAEAA